MSFGGSTSSQKSNTKTEPWAPAQPMLKDILGEASGLVSGAGVTPGQQTAFDQLKANANAGNPAAPAIRDAATDALGYDASPLKQTVGDAYSGLQESLGKYASGDYLDVMNNPALKEMMDVVGTDVTDRINRQFAGAGRDFSGSHFGAVAKGVTSAQLPLLLDQFNKQQDKQIGAAGQLFGAGTTTATTQGQLDQLMQAIRGGGMDFSEKALQAENYGPNAILALEQQMKNLPAEDLALLASLVTPIAGLGGTSNTKGSSSTLGFKIG